MTLPPRVLAIDPSPRGFGYAILEGRTRLVDWGLAHVAGPNKNEESLRRFRDLLILYRPQVVAVEDCASAQCRRRQRARMLIRDVAILAQSHAAEVVAIGWDGARWALRVGRRANKEVVIGSLKDIFPELTGRVPPHRRTWMSEDPRTSIFDAVALGLAAIHQTTSEEAKAESEA